MTVRINVVKLRGRVAQRLRISGSSALALSAISTNLIRIVSTICLSRLLAPEVYGVTGLIVSVFFVINMLSDVGFQAYVVRHEQSNHPEFMNSVWTIHAGRGVLLTVISALLAWPVSIILGKPEIALPLAISSFIFVIEGQSSLNQFIALREGRVQRFALLDFAGSFMQAIAAIGFAVFVRNIWAVVASMLIGSFARVFLSYALFPGGRRSYRLDRFITSDLWRFSRMIAASSALTLVITQIDKLALSRIMTLSQFGTYVIATTLAAAPTVFAFNYCSTIVYPITAAAWREGASIKNAYYNCWGKFFYAYAFCGGALIAGAPLLIRVLYDPRYLAAGRYLTVLAIATAMTMATRSMMEVLVASGRPRGAVELNSVRLLWLISGGLFAIYRTDAMTFVLTIGLIEVPVYIYACSRLHQLHLISWTREASLALTVAGGVAMGCGANWLGQLFLPNL